MINKASKSVNERTYHAFDVHGKTSRYERKPDGNESVWGRVEPPVPLGVCDVDADAARAYYAAYSEYLKFVALRVDATREGGVERTWLKEGVKHVNKRCDWSALGRKRRGEVVDVEESPGDVRVASGKRGRKRGKRGTGKSGVTEQVGSVSESCEMAIDICSVEESDSVERRYLSGEHLQLVRAQVTRFLQFAWKRDYAQMSHVVGIVQGMCEGGVLNTAETSAWMFLDEIEEVAAGVGVSPAEFFREIGMSDSAPSVAPARVADIRAVAVALASDVDYVRAIEEDECDVAVEIAKQLEMDVACRRAGVGDYWRFDTVGVSCSEADRALQAAIAKDVERSGSCDICGKTDLKSLRLHLLTHSKPVGCSMEACDERFVSIRDMRRHVIVHHPSLMQDQSGLHCCGKCGKTFNRRDNYARHLRRGRSCG